MGAMTGNARGRGMRTFSAFGAGTFILAVAAITWAVTGWIVMEIAQRASL